MKANTLFLVDLFALISFIPTALTGFMLHRAGHQPNHEIWHNWAVAHIFSSLLFTILIATHIYEHWGWYKSLLSIGIKNKSRVTITLTILVIIVIITGNVVLFQHQGANSHIGLWHYILGIILTIISVGHFLKRVKILFKGLRKGFTR